MTTMSSNVTAGKITKEAVHGILASYGVTPAAIGTLSGLPDVAELVLQDLERALGVTVP